MSARYKFLLYFLVILIIGFTFSFALAAEFNPPNPPVIETPTPLGDLDQQTITPTLIVPQPTASGLTGERVPPEPAPEGEAVIEAPTTENATIINAVVLRSWSYCASGGVIWNSLNDTWSSYGSTPIHITYNYPGLCSGTITYENLVASGADVLIISDPSGAPQQYSAAEISAIQQYASEGHNLIGTFALFQWSTYDNRGLAPLFGLQAGITYNLVSVAPVYDFLEPGNPLFTDLSAPYASSGYAQTQVPASGTWSAAALNGARFVGITADQKAAILVYNAPNYHAIYITNMPEYGGGTADKQFFYNAITYKVVEAVVLRSWSGCSGVIWNSLNDTWSSYGSTPVHITYNYPGLCDGPITYAALVASGADVLIISNPSGGGQQYSPAEISAIQQYASEGHNLIGTFALLQWSDHDNRGLAPLFGLQAGLTYSTVSVAPVYDFLEPSNPLFTDLSAPYASSGYAETQVPASGTWSAAALNGARFVGITADQKAAILVYDTSRYHAIYITNMPEYGGGTADQQFFYNAITYHEINAVVLRSWHSCLSDTAIWDSLNSTWSDYGSTPIHITYNYPGLCNGTITYATLVASGADVLVISDAFDGFPVYSPDEISAIQQYVNEGHNLIGTFLLLQYGPQDNRGLAPMFGLRSDLIYDQYFGTAPVYNFLEPNTPLFKDLAEPYVSTGYPYSQVPTSGIWEAASLNGARIVGVTADKHAVITVYDAASYHAIFISNMPEFYGGTTDKQFFYNAIAFQYQVRLPVIRK